VQATGFVEHLKLPHHVDFQSELGLVRRMRAEFAAANGETAIAEGDRREADFAEGDSGEAACREAAE
jgi:alpha-D-ribose 1-methylphosphonate 5-triphosphate synthase subunit PhnI